MNPPAKLSAFALVLALVFGGATFAGRAIDPFDDAPAPAPHEVEHSPAPEQHGTTTTSTSPAEQHEEHEEGQP